MPFREGTGHRDFGKLQVAESDKPVAVKATETGALYTTAQAIIKPPNKAEKHVLDLTIARTDELVTENGVSISILKATGTFTLKIEFLDGSTIELKGGDEIVQGDTLQLEFSRLYFSNTAQDGVVVLLIGKIA